MKMTLFYILLASAYFLGSISTAVLVCRLMKYPDPRQEGSANPGATNVLRIAGRNAAIATLVGDMLKGFLPVAIAKLFGIGGFAAAFIAYAAILGHLFPVFFGFKGGKGVATTLGAFLALSPSLALAVTVTWLIVLALSRYVSLASIVAISLAPMFSQWLASRHYFLPLVLITITVLWRHRKNIERLLDKSEPKFGEKLIR